MPPRLRFQALSTPLSQRSSIPTFLLPFLSAPSRQASILTDLSDTPEAYSKRIRRGRGPSSGKGKTSGRGHKGQKQHGKVPAGLTGGQTPDHIVHGRFGFENPHRLEMSKINLDTIQSWITAGRLDPSKPITLKELSASRALHGVKEGGVKLLARGAIALTTPIHLVVSRASQAAIAAVEALGGSVTTRFYTPQAIRRIKEGTMDPYVSLRWDPQAIGVEALNLDARAADPAQRAAGLGHPYRLPDPSGRKDLEYYRDPRNRGYLSHTVKQSEGEVPDLYFSRKLARLKRLADESKGEEGGAAAAEREKRKRVDENRLW